MRLRTGIPSGLVSTAGALAALGLSGARPPVPGEKSSVPGDGRVGVLPALG